MREGAALIALALLAAGCVGSVREGIAEQSTAAQSRPVVVALIDSGVTPYVPIFASQIAIPDHLKGKAMTFDFAQDGSYDERWEADRGSWESVEAGQLYWFKGTKLLGISFDKDARYKLIDGHVAVHGTATSYLVARDATDVLIVGIQVGNLPAAGSSFVDTTVADAMEWIADQDWIDVVSISWGHIGNPPSRGALDPVELRYVLASERAAASGKIIVNAAGNVVVPSLLNPFNGPPWIITVGGSNHGGEPADSSKLVDVVANYSEVVPKPWTVNETAPLGGTSMATPIVAATIATAIGQVRTHDRSPGVASSYREALNATATYFAPTDWKPAPLDPSDPFGTIGENSYPVLFQTQMGWGYVDASMAPEIARRVLEDDLAPPSEKSQAMLFQPRWQEARERYWAQYAY